MYSLENHLLSSYYVLYSKDETVNNNVEVLLYRSFILAGKTDMQIAALQQGYVDR